MKTKRTLVSRKMSFIRIICCSLMLSCSLGMFAQQYPQDDIVDLTAITGKKWKVETEFNVYSQLFIDRAYFAATVDPFTIGSTYIMPANDDRTYAKDDLATFTVKSDADVYIAHSQGMNLKPNWLTTEYDETTYSVISDNSETYWLYKKNFPAGSKVTVGKNGSSTSGQMRSMYFIIVKPAGANSIQDVAGSDYVKVSGNNVTAAEQGSFTIYSVSGAAVLNVENVDSIEVDLATGVYVLQFVGESGKKVYKKFAIK